MFKWGEKSLTYLDDPRLHPKIKVFMSDVLRESRYDISIIDGARDKVEQFKLYQNGNTELDGVTYLSDHQIEKLLS